MYAVSFFECYSRIYIVSFVYVKGCLKPLLPNTGPRNVSRGFFCPNRYACIGGKASVDGSSPMCDAGYEGLGCVECSAAYGPSDSNSLVCAWASTPPAEVSKEGLNMGAPRSLKLARPPFTCFRLRS